MWPKNLKIIKNSLDPEAYVAENLEKYKRIAWTQSLCIPKPRKKSKNPLDLKLVYPKTSKKSKFRLTPKLVYPKT